MVGGDRMILQTLIAALAVSYAFYSRKMKDPMVIAKLLLQVMVTFILIQILLDLTSLFKTDGIVPAADGPQPNVDTAQPKADTVQPNADTVQPNADTVQPNADTGSSWYSSRLETKKFWGCVILMIAGLAGIAYYLKGFAPVSPDDMNSFTTAVSQGIDHASSEQVSLGQTLAERVNSAFGQKSWLEARRECYLILQLREMPPGNS